MYGCTAQPYVVCGCRGRRAINTFFVNTERVREVTQDMYIYRHGMRRHRATEYAGVVGSGEGEQRRRQVVVVGVGVGGEHRSRALTLRTWLDKPMHTGNRGGCDI